MFVLLVGPKGSGKSHIGRILERGFGVFFFHVEPLWMAYYADCKARGLETTIPDGIAEVHPRVAEALRTHEHVCVETTGASREILDDLQRLAPAAQMLVVRVAAPLELCLRRIATREQADQIPMNMESIRKVHALSVAAPLEPGLVLENSTLSEGEIVSRFREAFALRAHGPRARDVRIDS